jgi:hypothetical protein
VNRFIFFNFDYTYILDHRHEHHRWFEVGSDNGIGIGNADVSPINMGRISPSVRHE